MPELAIESVQSAVLWPERYQPRRAEIFAQHTLDVPRPPETVWAWLVRAEAWPAWQPDTDDVHFLSHAGPDLRNRSRLRWTDAGRRLTLKVLEFEPCTRLGWDVSGLGIEGYHGWVLTALPDGGTRVVSEEVRSGWRSRLMRMFAAEGLKREQARWLEALSAQAQTVLTGQPGRQPNAQA